MTLFKKPPGKRQCLSQLHWIVTVTGNSARNEPFQVENSLLAVSTPGGEELHQPQIIAVQHHLIKVVISELNNVLLASATAVATAAALLQDSYL